MKIKTILVKVKKLYTKLKTSKINIRSLLFLKIVIGISLIPILLYIGVWTWVVIGRGEPPLIDLLQDMRQFVGTVFSTQVVAGVLAYGVALIDKDRNGESDEMEQKVKGIHKNENND